MRERMGGKGRGRGEGCAESLVLEGMWPWHRGVDPFWGYGGRAAYLREGTFAARPNSGVVFLECFVVRYKVALEHRLPILD